jgi:hypothetical protein
MQWSKKNNLEKNILAMKKIWREVFKFILFILVILWGITLIAFIIISIVDESNVAIPWRAIIALLAIIAIPIRSYLKKMGDKYK